jgi:glycosyltransferase involved in cell wall biosynthesis
MNTYLKDNPVFSIVIPCYNQGDFLKDCLNSILNQDYQYWETIIINDGSTDNTKEVINGYKDTDARIKIVEQSNKGLSEARNAGLKIVQGDYILFLDADDWLNSHCLSCYSFFLKSNSDFELIRCGYAHWDNPNGTCLHKHIPEENGSIFPKVMTSNIGPCHSILIDRKFAEKLGGFDPLLKSCEDWDFWIRAGKMGARIYSIPDILVGYRYVAHSMSRNPKMMYNALSEVSRRASQKDSRLPKNAPLNFEYQLDYTEIQKNHLIRMLGVMIHQGKVKEAVEWYKEEKNIWKWVVNPIEWRGLSSYLSWGYFFDRKEIEKLLNEILPLMKSFLSDLGYSEKKCNHISKMVFSPHFKKQNHYRFGKIIGAGLNKIGRY